MNKSKGDQGALVSVIIPIYKVEDYLKTCVDSVLQQSYQQLEVILVDDGSPDDCGAICDAYAAADPRVLVIHRANGGLSAARNSGLECATGEFITFVDSDDWIDRETIAGYMRLFAEHPELDLVESMVYSSKSLDPCLLGQHIPNPGLYDCVVTQREFLERLCMTVHGRTSPSVWNKCYRRTLIGPLRFREGYVFEDLDFQLRLSVRLRHYMNWSRLCYFYRTHRPGAITEAIETKLIPKFADNYNNMQHILLHLRELKKQGFQYPEDSISLEEHEAYIATRFITEMIRPPYFILARSQVRKLLYQIQAPYFKFLADYPYLASVPRWRRERWIAIRSYTLYMKGYLPTLYAYGRVRRAIVRLKEGLLETLDHIIHLHHHDPSDMLHHDHGI